MRTSGRLLSLAAALFTVSAAQAAEKGILIRASELKAQPFIDAATTERLAANQPLTILARQGGWMRVDSSGKAGWVRMLNVRLDAIARPANGSATSPASASQLHTGSRGRTVTTGVKGMDEADIRASSIDLEQLAILTTLAIEPAVASDHAAKQGIKENQVEYLKTSDR